MTFAPDQDLTTPIEPDTVRTVVGNSEKTSGRSATPAHFETDCQSVLLGDGLEIRPTEVGDA
mgnify:CR=1 FL=1